MPANSENFQIDADFGLDDPALAITKIKAWLQNLPAPEQMAGRETILAMLEKSFEADKPLPPNWLETIFAVSPLLINPKEFVRTETAPLASEYRLSQLLAKALAPLPAAKRQDFLMPLIGNLSDISLACAFLLQVEGTSTEEPNQSPGEQAYFGPESQTLRNALLRRIEEFGATGALWMQVSPAQLLWFWWACKEQDTYVFVQRAMHGAKALSALLEVPVERILTPQGEVDVILVRRWSKILDFQSLEKYALDLALTGASKQDRNRARRFLTAFGNGKSDLYN
jgi:hypothetical protein